MTHDTAWELALRDLETPLSAVERRALEEHLAGCSECRAQMKSLRVVHAALLAADPIPLVEQARRIPRAGVKSWLRVAAVFLVAAASFAVGRKSADSSAKPTTGQHRYVLLLEEPQDAWPPAGGAPLSRKGYGQWARDLGRENRLTGGGIQLSSDDGWYVDRNGNATPARNAPVRQVNFSGFFVVTANNYTEALQLARASPHLGWGGILVRQASRP